MLSTRGSVFPTSMVLGRWDSFRAFVTRSINSDRRVNPTRAFFIDIVVLRLCKSWAGCGSGRFSRIGSGRAGSGGVGSDRVGSGWVGSDPVGSGQ